LDFGGFCKRTSKKKVVTNSQAETTTAQGKLSYHIPTQMEFEKVTRCVVRISVNEQVIQEELENLKTQNRDIIIAEVMKVTLSEATSLEGKHFEIEAVSENKQRVRIKDIKNYTEWLFNVKPIKKGTHKLSLKVYIIEKIDNEEITQQLTFEEVVIVSSKEENKVKESNVMGRLKQILSFTLPSYNTVKVIGNNNTIIQNSKNVIIGSNIGNIGGDFIVGDKMRSQINIGGNYIKQEADKAYNIEKIENANFDGGFESVTLNLFGILSLHIKMYSKSNEKFAIDLRKGISKDFNTLQFSQRAFLKEFPKPIDKTQVNDLKPVFRKLLGLLQDMQKQSPESVSFGDVEVNVLTTLYILATDAKVNVIYEKYNELFENQGTSKADIVNALQVLADYGLITQNDNGEIMLIETVKMSRYE
jgi:uncharacterized protein Smg (DUF494 family)